MIQGSFFTTSTKGFDAEIKRRYSDFIVEEITPEKEVCKVDYFLKENGEKQGMIIPERQEGSEDKFIHFNLEKINLDLSFALRNLARRMFVSRKRFGYSGIKDKRAITCQKISFFVSSQEEVERLGRLTLNKMHLSSAEWKDYRLDLGMLYGNRFRIVLRNISRDENELRQAVQECFDEMKEKGTANYFGAQRFGGIRQVSHLIGRAIIKEDLKEAVMLFLTHYNEKEIEEIVKARKKLAETLDFEEAKKNFPKELFLEKAVLDALIVHPKDYANAFRQIPKNLRYFFTHAYQSFLFNKIIDERFRQGIGLEVQGGEKQENGEPLGLLPGYESEFDEGIVGEIERKVLEEEEVSLEEFKIKKLSECSSRGSRKSILLKPLNPLVVEIKDDEFYEGKKACTVSFDLTKGNYATSILREILKKDV